MKYISSIFLVCLFLLTSCEDFLIQENPNTITDQSFWKTEEDAIKGLMATYGAMQYADAMGGSTAANGYVRTDLAGPNPWETGPISLHTYAFNDATNYVVNKWTHCYMGIFRANQVIENLPNIQADESIKKGIEGEAKFLRGLFYFWLYNNYNKGSIIIHTKVPKTVDDFHKELSPKEEVLALIIEDIKFAKANLPETWEESQLGRATWGAATSLLGKIYLYEAEWAKAVVEFEEVIESNLYSLTPNIADNFNIQGEFNSESIFEVVFSDAVKPGFSGYKQDGPTGSESSTRPRLFASSKGNGWRVVRPSYFMVHLLKQDPIDPAKPVNAGQTFSQRALASLCFPDDGQMFYQVPSIEHDNNSGEPGYVRKFQNWTLPKEVNESRSGINERVIRLADVYLMYAEALLESGGSFTEALEYVNKVRRRSAVLELEETDFDKESLLTHIKDVERACELCFEGHEIRWHDMRRWGGIKERLAALKEVPYFYQPQQPLKIWEEGDLEEAKKYEFVDAYDNYTIEDDYFPIPNKEAITNAGLQIDSE